MGETVLFCDDSDEGRNYSEKGQVVNNTVTNSDSCWDGGEVVDSCSGPTCSVQEFYCDGTLNVNETVSCDYGCSDGACVSAPVTCTLDGVTLNAGENHTFYT